MVRQRCELYKNPMSTTNRSTMNPLHILSLEPSLLRGDQAGSVRAFTICQELSQSGHHVSVLTTYSNLTSGTDDPKLSIVNVGNDPQMRFGYPVPTRANRSYVLNVLWRIWRISDVDVVIAADRPLLILPIATLFCAVRGIPLIVDARDGIPRPSPQASQGRKMLTLIAQGIYRFVVRRAQRTFIQNIHLKESLAANGVAPQKTIEALTGCDTHLLHPSKTVKGESAPTSQSPSLVYAGHIYAEDNLEAFVDIAVAMQPISPSFAVLFYGDGPGRAHLEQYARSRGVLNKNVWVLDPVPRFKLPSIFASATAAIGRRADEEAWDPCGHVFDALAAERPVIFAGQNPHRDLVVGRGAGIALPTDDIPAATHEIFDFLNNADGLRRAREQAAALAAGRINTRRVAADIRDAIEAAVEEVPRATIMRQRMLWSKRALDILLSIFALIVLSPVLIGLAIAIGVKMGAPVIFSQDRPGFKGKLFRIYKFRTMTDAADATGATLPDGDRLTPLGRFMRRTSLDELPELFNVLRGDMSLVGPRPLLPEYLPYYSSEQRRRHEVRPGITGWTQINGRNALSWEEKFTYDVWYVDNMSLGLDFKILAKTFWVTLRGDGVNAPGHSTMPRFDEIMARREGAEDN